VNFPNLQKIKKGCININNNDNKCFLWSMLAYLHPDTNHVDRISHYQKYETEFNFKSITNFPMDFKIFIDLNTNVILKFVYLK